MRNNYQYVDPDYSYTDPKTGVLRNLAGITEYDLVIHNYLFQDVYEWAGKVRTVEISKQGKQFFPRDRFGEAFSYIDSLITDYRKIDIKDAKGIAYYLAIILDSVNFLHPFREGNGRTQREFIRILALEKGFVIYLNPSDSPDVYERYMSGTIDGDVQKLRDLIFVLLKKPE
jgi:cell filamentation protein